MPTTDLQALNAEVARAMGWEPDTNIAMERDVPTGNWSRRRDGQSREIHFRCPPPYATADPSTPEGAVLLAEMLQFLWTWAKERGEILCVALYPDDAPVCVHTLLSTIHEIGDTLLETLARAVAATAPTDAQSATVQETER